MAKKIIGIDLGGTSIKLAIVTQQGDIQQKWSIPTNILDGGAHIVPDMIASIKHKIALLNLTTEDFLGIGMGSPGVVNRENGTVTGAYNLGWKETQKIKEPIEKELGLPFFIDNDANVAALGEQWVGAGSNNPDVVFITLGTGVGGGIIADGNLIHGVAGAGGEIGHMTVDFDEPFACTCGKKGCLETVASATGIVNLARRYSERFAGESQLKERIDNAEDVSAKMVMDLAKEGDHLAVIVYEHFAEYLGMACADIAALLNPATIVIGGGVSAAGEFLLTGVQKYFNQHTFPQVRETTKLDLAKLSNDAGVIGAASLVTK
ncbi:glucokinase [Granulicatella balaenopterae]|uniref:Glucokinase n=1 Tax=Granulicatella balaenopterae TaxID=137733 RepID=A0A1H9MRG6_9LACT|nr:ROK family glucokinase [Granulicatella balaenopterae]SER26228.1 glucokinase [Granulicatella balaenopterae]